MRPVLAAFGNGATAPSHKQNGLCRDVLTLVKFAGPSLVLLRSQCPVCGGVAAPTEGGVRRTNLSWVPGFNTVVLALPQTLLATRAKEALVCREILACFPGALAHHQRWTVLCRMWGPTQRGWENREMQSLAVPVPPGCAGQCCDAQPMQSRALNPSHAAPGQAQLRTTESTRLEKISEIKVQL